MKCAVVSAAGLGQAELFLVPSWVRLAPPWHSLNRTAFCAFARDFARCSVCCGPRLECVRTHPCGVRCGSHGSASDCPSFIEVVSLHCDCSTGVGLFPIIGSNVIIFITVPLLSGKFEKWHSTGTQVSLRREPLVKSDPRSLAPTSRAHSLASACALSRPDPKR